MTTVVSETCVLNCTVTAPVTSHPVVYSVEMIRNVIRTTNMCIAVFGILTNLCNVEIFRRTGILESATSITLFALTVTDLLSLVLFIVNPLLDFRIGTSPPLVYTLYVQVLYSFQMTYKMSTFFTVYLTVQKCCCVALPLKFKFIFTIKKVLATLLVLTLVCFACYAPLFLSIGFRWAFIPRLNKTVVIPNYSPYRQTIVIILYPLVLAADPTISQVVVISCLFVLTGKLKQATKFRMSSELPGSKEPSKGAQLSGKELRAVQSVVVVAAMFVVCNLPSVLIMYASYVEPEFNDFRQLGEIYSLVGLVRISLLLLCSSLNIFVYITYNSSYRQQVAALWRKLGTTRSLGKREEK
ncbi:uncharacterized protein LOC101864341 [Aplysia californica]|uniref:Uncharacterized protein LOC101864341 n=1 Tax=Aplysia californica TaxID=6500 RepID=A0ABM0K6W3_APLCA|nr:uncharacterized protein LOC101864341 [Aplysia californica]